MSNPFRFDKFVSDSDTDDEKLRQTYLKTRDDITRLVANLRTTIRSSNVSNSYKEQLLNSLNRELARM